MTNEDHNKYLSYSFLAYAGINFLSIVFIFGIMFAALLSDGAHSVAFFVMAFAMLFVTAIFTLPSAIAGWAGLKKKPWARVAGIVASITSVTNLPLGTLAGIYGLWFYFSNAWRDVYGDFEYVQRGELPDAEDFKRWEADAARCEDQRERVPPQGDWR